VGRRLRVPGSRDVRAILDRRDSPAVVVACPPHPGMGGDRSDPRLRAVSDALGERDGTVDPEPVAERARQHDGTVETLGADHFFLGQQQRIGALAAAFLPGRP